MRSLPAETTTLPPLHGEGGVQRDFDTNMAVILAALLTALVCALGLSCAVRLALRCSGRGGGEGDEGVSKSALRKLPVSSYDGGDLKECPICLADFQLGEKVRALPRCGHVFHVRCIDTWLEARASCPTCRQSPLNKKGSAKLSNVHREPVVVVVVVDPINSVYL